MQIEVDMKKAVSLSKEIEKALSSTFDKKLYPLIITALEILQIEMVVRGLDKTIREEKDKDRLKQGELELLVKNVVSELLLDITSKTLSMTEFWVVSPKEMH